MVKCLLKRPSKSRCGGSLKIFHIYNTIRICISFYSNESQEKHLLGKVASCVASEITKRTDPMRFRKLEVGKTKKMLLAKCTFLMRGLYNKRRKKIKKWRIVCAALELICITAAAVTFALSRSSAFMRDPWKYLTRVCCLFRRPSNSRSGSAL